MDITLARTFLEIVETGSFAAAAERLNVTQSAVSMRVKALESELGRALFQRSRSGIQLTRAGRHFQKPAADIVRLWTHARQNIVLPDDVVARFAVGGEVSLWQGLLLEWVARLRSEVPDLAVRAEIGTGEVLSRLVGEGQLDLAVAYTPVTRPGLVVQTLLADRLVMVTTQRDRGGVEDPGYVFIDWGPAFRETHARAFPDVEMPRLSLGIGVSALTYLYEVGGSGYFPARVVAGDLAAGRLFRVSGAPDLSVPAYVIYTRSSLDLAWFTSALEILMQVANALPPQTETPVMSR